MDRAEDAVKVDVCGDVGYEDATGGCVDLIADVMDELSFGKQCWFGHSVLDWRQLLPISDDWKVCWR